MPYASSGWNGSVETFLRADTASVLDSLKQHQLDVMLMGADHLQIAAWIGSIEMLRRVFRQLLMDRPEAETWHIAFEYVLPRERGRRPDVIVLADDTILVLEFKESPRPSIAFRDQVSAYGRDIAHYHAESHDREIQTILVMTRRSDPTPHYSEDVAIVGEDALFSILEAIKTDPTQAIDPDKWLDADYEPLPSLVAAARLLFENEPLPSIRRAHSAGIPFTLATLANIREEAIRTRTKHLVLVTGVPGAGKTLVGLQFVYESRGDDGSQRTAVMLSGNVPLVQVLQHALKSGIFVQDVHGFLKQYGGDRRRAPKEHVLIYDEAQRAWDGERVSEQRGHSNSEPEDFLLIGSRMDGWALMVGLIGEGQEIHHGEEGGLGLWNDAIASTGGGWIVHCPERIVSTFTNASRVETSATLDLSESLRSHLARDVQQWVSYFLAGDFSTANDVSKTLSGQGFDAYFSRDLDVCKQYVRSRYEKEVDKRYGLLASSQAKNLKRWDVDNEFLTMRKLKVGPWYNDPPDSPLSCCQLEKVATEFYSQGLELDFPIVCWGDDLNWNGSAWQLKRRGNRKLHDPLTLRRNGYRVLLSRGRDGFVVFVPPEAEMDAVAAALRAGGIQELRQEMVKVA